MRRSDIFESFVKIAEQKGLVSKGSPESVKEILEKTHRADSLSIEQIAKLYGNKPNAPKDMEYKRNIVEIAHPTPLVIAPSYDKLNGLVENINERQDILLHIVNKTNDGQLPNRKYAEKQLILSLVRLGNDMDNRGQKELANLADACLYQASAKPLKKNAQLQVLIPAIAAVVGALYAKQHMRFHSDGFSRDYDKAISEIDDLLNSSTTLGLIGTNYTPAFIGTLNQLKTKLSELNTAVQAVLPELDKLEAPHSGPELVALSKQPDSHEAVAALQNFRQVVKDVYPYLYTTVRDFSDEGYKQRQVADKGFFNQVVDSTEVLHGGKGMVADDFDDVAHALQTLFVDVQNIVKGLEGSDSEQAAAQQQLQAAQATMPGGEAGEEAPTTPTLPTAHEMGGAAPSGGNVEGVQADQLQKELEGASWEDLVG